MIEYTNELKVWFLRTGDSIRSKFEEQVVLDKRVSKSL